MKQQMNSHSNSGGHPNSRYDKQGMNNGSQNTMQQPMRKRAGSNYFQLDADRKRTSTMHEAHESFSERLSMMNVLSKPDGQSMPGDFQDEQSIDYCCDLLQAKFGFQPGSVDNQREHVLLLLANCKARAQRSDDNHHVSLLHRKMVGNYIEWCKFLRIEPNWFKGEINAHLVNPQHMELMLYFLIWGEAGNLRHMPECLCFLFHKFMGLLNSDLGVNERKPTGWFLTQVARPIWKECANMQRKNSLGKHLEHIKVRNYDDINEFFWKVGCLDSNVEQVGADINMNHGKTFYEHRSIFTLVLNYYRIFHFNLMFLIVLSVLSFAVTISPNGYSSGFKQFSKIGTVVEPFTKRDLNLAFVGLVLSHSALNFFKCVLEICHGWQLLFSTPSNSKTSSKSFSYGAALTLRLLWNGGFSGLFALMIQENPVPAKPLSDSFGLVTAAYLIPGAIILLLQSFSPSYVMRQFGARFVREGESCYLGRNMSPPLSYQLKYIAFWVVLWFCKAVVSYWVLINPLMLPSLAIYEMNLKSTKALVSFHNIGIIISLWAPVVFVFNYDTQIYFTIFQAVLGGVKGLIMKTGEVHGIHELSKSFRVAPQLFDQKVVTSLARSNDADNVNNNSDRPSVNNSVFQSQMMLRFVVVWNEIVNSFREGDLVDDKEAAILQYDIQSTGEVFEPVFLSAGKLGEAMNTILKLSKSNKGDSELRIHLVKNDCLSAVKSFFNASMYVMEALLGSDDAEVIDGFRQMEQMAIHGDFMKSFHVKHLSQVRTVSVEFLEAVLDLPDPDTVSTQLQSTKVHTMGVIRNFVGKMENILNALQMFCKHPELVSKFNNIKFVNSQNGYVYAARGLVNLFHSDTAMGAATRAYLLMSLEKPDAMPRCTEAKRRLGFFMKSLMMEIPQLRAINEMRSFSVVTPFYSESVIFSLNELSNPLENHPIFKRVEEDGKNITILKYLITIHPEEWENFLERIDVSSVEEALTNYPQEIRLWASYRGQALARTVQGMMLYEDAIKILHWLEIGSSSNKTPEQKQSQLEDMVRLKFSYICACQVYGKHRLEGKQQADDIDFLLHTYPNLRVAYVDTIPTPHGNQYDTVLIKSQDNEVMEVYRYELPGDPILGEGKPENQNNALQFTRGEFLQTIDMNQQHYFEECLKMPQLLVTADLHPSKKPVSIIGMREHIFTGNASSLAKFKTWQELVFVTLSQRVLADPLYCRMHYGHPDIFDKVMCLTRGGVSKASKGINLSEDVFAGFNTTLRGGVITHVEFMQCGKGRDVALSQISMFEGKLGNGSGETSLSREAHRMGQFFDFFRLNSMYYSHTGFYFATWLTIVTTFVYMYSKVYIALANVQMAIVTDINSTQVLVISKNLQYDFDTKVFYDLANVFNTQYFIQAGLFLTLPLMAVYFTEMGLLRGFVKFFNMIITGGPAFFVFQVGTTMHYFDNNILHGGAKYQATGRGFKITRETFVLLYKAYANSHYRKAFELIGLCLVYGEFGDFNVGDNKVESTNKFLFDYTTTAQGYGTQTFAVWFIAIIWLLAPFVFNTDGLDYEKTKADVRSWCHWMFMQESEKEKEEDAVTNGGWITYWKSEEEMYHGTKLISRFTVIIRESRHFLLMWYVVTLRYDIVKVPMVLAATGASLVIFMFLNVGGMAMRSVQPVARAALYLVFVTVAVVAFFVLTNIFKQSFSDSLALFFGFTACLYGVNEMVRVFSFSSFSVANIGLFQQLAFFFDFIFGISLLIPLFVLSCIPFMNVIQTRMMYNEGFSKVMSASSQYAFSLAAVMGVLGGAACGWLYFLLTSLDTSSGYISYIVLYKITDSAGSGSTSYFVLYSAIGGSLISGLLGYFIGRRLTIVIGGLCSTLGMVILSAVPTYSQKFLFPGLGLFGVAIGLTLPSVAIYIFEISTKEMRGKTMLLLGVGFIIGTLAASLLSSGELGWVWQVFWCSVMLAVITPAVNMFPESPYWVLERQGIEACEACLIVLRRKQDVAEELKEMREDQSDEAEKSGGANTYKIILGLFLILVSTLSTGSLNTYVGKLLSGLGDQSRMFSNCVALELVGALLSFFFIDKLEHRTILAATLIPVALCAGVLGAQDCFNLLNDKPDGNKVKIFSQIICLLMYFFKGCGLASILWVSCVGIFTTKVRFTVSPIYFAVFFAIPIMSLYLRLKNETKSAYLWLFGLAGCSIIVVLMVLVAGSRRNGMLCTRAEMKHEKARHARTNGRSARTPGSSRNRYLSRSRSKSGVKNNYHLMESPAANSRSNSGYHPHV